MEKTPEEAKKGLEACAAGECHKCPYRKEAECTMALSKDALALIQQLEAQVPKWISVEERLPENEKTVFIITKWSFMGKEGLAVSMAFHTDGKTFTGDSAFDWNSGDVDLTYDEENDEYIVPEGWWESVRYSESFSAVDEPILYWAESTPLPEPPKEG